MGVLDPCAHVGTCMLSTHSWAAQYDLQDERECRLAGSRPTMSRTDDDDGDDAYHRLVVQPSPQFLGCPRSPQPSNVRHFPHKELHAIRFMEGFNMSLQRSSSYPLEFNCKIELFSQ
jgi:hypothetical protein